jgi:hypothetical protein
LQVTAQDKLSSYFLRRHLCEAGVLEDGLPQGLEYLVGIMLC